MKTMEMFETHWADVHDLPVETLAQYRHATKDGYRLPGMASHYRTFCAALQAAPKASVDVMTDEEFQRRVMAWGGV
jgi:hypothetical protein